MISLPSCTSKSEPDKTAVMCRLLIPCSQMQMKENKQMTQTPHPSEDRYAHLRRYAASQKQTTVDRLSKAIKQLEREQCPVTTFTIKEVSGLDYMAYYRN